MKKHIYYKPEWGELAHYIVDICCALHGEDTIMTAEEMDDHVKKFTITEILDIIFDNGGHPVFDESNREPRELVSKALKQIDFQLGKVQPTDLVKYEAY